MAEAVKHPTVFDAGKQQLADVYAKALLGAAQQAEGVDAVLEEFGSLLEDALDSLPQVEAVWVSPRVPHESKVEMIDKAFGGKAPSTLARFLKVLSRHGRMDCLRNVYRSAQKQANDIAGRVEVLLQTAVEADDASLQQVKTQLQTALGADVILQTEINPELLGGVVIRVGDTVYDASLSNQLQRLRSSLSQKVSQALQSRQRSDNAE